MWPKCGPNAARMWPEYEILWPVINPWTFPVARARPEPKPQARNPARTMKKVARPSPNFCVRGKDGSWSGIQTLDILAWKTEILRFFIVIAYHIINQYSQRYRLLPF